MSFVGTPKKGADGNYECNIEKLSMTQTQRQDDTYTFFDFKVRLDFGVWGLSTFYVTFLPLTPPLYQHLYLSPIATSLKLLRIPAI